MHAGGGSSDVLQGAVGSLHTGPVARGGHAAVPSPHFRGSRSCMRDPSAWRSTFRTKLWPWIGPRRLHFAAMIRSFKGSLHAMARR
jgi:hypothetical protein